MMAPPIFPVAPKPLQTGPGDYFDQLPDPIVGAILSRVVDAKSLCRCLAVSRRIASLVPEADTVSVTANPKPPKKKSLFSFKSLFAKLLRHPTTKPNSAVIGPGELSHWISNSVKNFSQARHLRVRLPGNGGVVGYPDPEGGLLKWTAQFGSELQRAAIIGATAFKPGQGQGQRQRQPSEEELRSRIVWILSSLIAASARHGVARKTLLDSPRSLVSAVVDDAQGQGRLVMDKTQIKEVRESGEPEEGPVWKRTNVPNVNVKLWYCPEVVLPRSGYLMEGATVVAIRPDSGLPEEDGGVGGECELLRAGVGVDEAEEGVIGEAVAEIVKSKCTFMYKLQMKSFI